VFSSTCFGSTRTRRTSFGEALHQDRGEDRVDAARLPEPVVPGDEDVRHLRQVGPDRLPSIPLPSQGDQRRSLLRPGRVDVAEPDQAPLWCSAPRPDRLLAGDRREDSMSVEASA